jgi:hypothetical protein
MEVYFARVDSAYHAILDQIDRLFIDELRDFYHYRRLEDVGEISLGVAYLVNLIKISDMQMVKTSATEARLRRIAFHIRRMAKEAIYQEEGYVKVEVDLFIKTVEEGKLDNLIVPLKEELLENLQTNKEEFLRLLTAISARLRAREVQESEPTA